LTKLLLQEKKKRRDDEKGINQSIRRTALGSGSDWTGERTGSGQACLTSAGGSGSGGQRLDWL
jgi:hypothetical protein